MVKFWSLKSVPVSSYELPRRRRRRRRRRRPAPCSETGYENGQYTLVLYNHAVLRHETKTKLLILTSRSIAKTSYTIRSSGVLLQMGRVFLMTFIVGVKSYMEVSMYSITIMLSIIKDLGPPTGLHINLSKCDLFSIIDLSNYPTFFSWWCPQSVWWWGAAVFCRVYCSRHSWLYVAAG